MFIFLIVHLDLTHARTLTGITMFFFLKNK